MSEGEKSRLEHTRRSIRSRVSRESLTAAGVPVDLTPVVEGARRRFGKVGIGLLALLIMGAVTAFMLRPQDEVLSVKGKPVAYLELTRGSVGMLSAGGLRDQSRLLTLEPGAAIPAGAVLETSASTGRAALKLSDGGSLRLDADSRVRFTTATAVVLDRGAVYFDSEGRRGSEVEVRTTLGMVREIGTQFEVRLLAEEGGESTLRVRVREGRIIMRHGQESQEAGVGEELARSDDGSFERRSVDLHGPHWNWVVEMAPVPKVEGEALQMFLDWFAREGGWTLEYDPKIVERAPSIVMHGDLEGLNPFEAADTVLGGSNLKYRVEGERLIVAPTAGRQP